MPRDRNPKIAILYPGDRDARRAATTGNNRFADLFAAFAACQVHGEPAVYHDEFSAEVRQQLLQVDGVLVWVNPIEGGRDRALLDAMLREVAAAGVFVSAHPEIILKLGTKEVLYRTRSFGWGCDTHLYRSMEQMARELPARLGSSTARVLKRNRGNGGDGVWRVQWQRTVADDAVPQPASTVVVRHAKRGCQEEKITLAEFLRRCEPYFAGDGHIMIDQAFQERLKDGMVRCYLVHDCVAGFGHQAVNALYPAPAGAPATQAPPPGPRLYHPPTLPRFQALKRRLERKWIPALQRSLVIDTVSLPVLWDCDFLLGPKSHAGEDSYVLCEINASSVAPYPESVVPLLVAATLARVAAARRGRDPAP